MWFWCWAEWKLEEEKSGRTTLTYSTALHKFRFGLSPQLKPKFKLHISQLMDFQIQTPEPSAGLGVFFCQGRPLATFESMMTIGFRRQYFGRWSFCLGLSCRSKEANHALQFTNPFRSDWNFEFRNHRSSWTTDNHILLHCVILQFVTLYFDPFPDRLAFFHC